jgi:two-component system, LytTR family, sensor kinase
LHNRFSKCVRSRIFLLATVVCLHSISFAQPVPGFVVQNIGSHQGLPSSEIFEIFQDSKGFIWFGTNAGFSRYDGYSFENFQYLNQQRIGHVYSIKELADKSLWFCTETGLFAFNNARLSKITWKDGDLFTPIFDIAEDNKGTIIIGTGVGPAIIPATHRSTLVSGQPPSLKQYLVPAWQQMLHGRDRAVNKMAINFKGEMIIATLGSAFHFYRDRLTLLWTKSEPSDFITTVAIDSSGICSWGTALIGIKTWNRNKVDSFDETNTNGLYGAYELSPSAGDLLVFSAVNLFSYSPRTAQFRKLAYINELDIKWPTCMLVDGEGNFWLGSHEGVYYLKRNRFNRFTTRGFRKIQEVYSIGQTKTGDILAGTNRGFVYNIKNDTAIPYFNGKAVVPRAEVFDIYEDERNWIWFATGYQGISVYRNSEIQNLQVTDGLADNTIHSLFPDSRNDIWAIGDFGITRIRIDPDNDSLSMQKVLAESASSQDIKLFNAVEGPDHRLWVAGSPGLLRTENDRLKPYLLDRSLPGQLFMRDILKDDKGNVWIATTDYGLFQCYFDDKNQLQLRRALSIKDGLSTNTFLSLALDNSGNIWAGSYSGVSCIQLLPGNDFRISNFDSKDGFIEHNFYNMRLFRDRQGMIWTTGTTGITSFDPAVLLATKRTASVYITSVELLNADSTVSLYSQGNDLGDLSLNAANNSLTVHFTALHYSNPGALRYYYRFNQADTTWTEIASGRSISFRQLAPGNYTLQLKASLGGNEFTPVTNFRFHVAPPFWQRWWFVLPAFLLLAVLFFRLLRIRERNIREREAQKTELQKLKTISYQYQLEIEQVVNYFATSMSEQKTADDLLWDVSRNCISKLGFEDCVIYLKDDSRNVLVQKAAWGPKTTPENKIVNPIEIPVGRGIVGTVALSGKPEIIDDTALDPRYIIDDSERSSEIAVPITGNGKVIGVIDSEHSQKAFYTERHLQILTTIASLIADKIEKLNADQEVREREIQLIVLNRDLATSQLTALRAQMNPHFIFNALNSIQQYILKGDVDQANKYLSKFSRLQREVLNNSDQNFISLEKEIEMLNLYLELEQLRFSENFEYAISIENEIDPTEVKIPPMILQPFVENAIWHGLMPKKGSKQVAIEFILLSDTIMQCIIRDNGIGRQAAARLKESSATPVHKSRGLALVYERLQILKQQYQQPFEVQISDLMSPHGEIQGTNVSLLLFIGT